DTEPEMDRRAFLPVYNAGDDNNVNGTSSSATDVANSNETESRNILTAMERPPMNIVYPWSISYRGLIHYEAPRGSLEYIDINGRSRIRGFPQFGKIFLKFFSCSVGLMWWQAGD
ncbi:MAG: hypothetical protein Q9199_005988, partial [Rusavskia elegans]